MMTGAKFDRLCADARAYADALGVAAMLRMVNTQRSAFTLSGPRIMLRVFRFVPGEIPREYSAAHGYRPDAKDLNERIRADIKSAARMLVESGCTAPQPLRAHEHSS